MSIRKRAFAGTVWGQSGRIIEVCLSAAFSVFVVRRLGNEAYGTYALIFSIVGVANLLCSLGLNDGLTKHVPLALASGGESQVNQLFRRALSFRLILVTAGSIVLYLTISSIAVILHSPAIAESTVIVVTVFALQNLVEFLAAFYISHLNIRTYYAVRLVGQCISLTLVLALFSLFGTSVNLVLLAIIASSVATGASYLWGVRTRLKPAQAGELRIRPFIGYSLAIWLVNLFTFGLASQIDTLLIAYYLNDQTQISYYSIAALVVSKLYILLTGWSMVVIPSLSEAFAVGGHESLVKASGLYVKLQLAVMIPVLAFVAIRAEGLTSLVFGRSFQPSASLMAIYATFTLFSMLLLSGQALNVLYVAGGERTVIWLRITAGGLNVVLDIALIPLFGAMGAVVATGISIMLVSLGEMIVMRRLVNFPYPFSFAVKLCLACVLAVITTWLVPSTNWPSLISSGVVYAVVLGVAAWILKPLSQMDREVAADTNRHLALLMRYF